MPYTKKNALAELAKRLKPKGNDRLYFLIDYDDLYKAARIVSELAKVRDTKEYGIVHVREGMAIDAVENCRAIAEKRSEGWQVRTRRSRKSSTTSST